jgi:thiol:disulfide interchange protein DsbC
MKQTLAALLAPVLIAFSAAAWAQAESRIQRIIEERFGIKVEHVQKTPYFGLFEMKVGSRMLYTDENVTYLFAGSVFDGKTREDLTEARMEELSGIKWKDLPLGDAIKTVRGKGTRQIAVFSDPNCSFCKRFEQQLQAMDDVTIYTFLYPILSADSTDKSKAIWCSKDRSKAYYDLMLSGVQPAGGKCDTSAVEKNVALGRKLGVDGTPTSFTATGQRIVGARFDAVRAALDKPGK